MAHWVADLFRQSVTLMRSFMGTIEKREKKSGPSESVRQGKILRYLEKMGGYWIKVVSANRNGVSDIIGGVTVEITPEMVGKRVAVLCSFEVKDGKGSPSDLQEVHIEQVLEAGGIAGVVRSIDGVERLLNDC